MSISPAAQICLSLTLTSFIFMASPAAAEQAQSHQNFTNQAQAITAFNEQKEVLINSDEFFHNAVRFYHDMIDDHARFNLTVHDPRPNVPPQTLTLDKAQFMQGFLGEAQQLSAYDQEYSLNSIAPAAGHGNIFVADEQITETATVQTPTPQAQSGVSDTSFTAHTRCQSFYKFDNQRMTQIGAECETYIQFPENI
jgi:hypothetical protein